MLNIARLFGKSPFAPLKTHMQKVALCMNKLSEIFLQLDQANIEKLAGELSKLEHDADLVKNDIRNHLPKSLFLPIDRTHFLDILSIQDHIADKAEDIGILLALRSLHPFRSCHEEIRSFFQKNQSVFLHAKQIIEEIDELLESSFGGLEAEKVKTMVEQTAYQEYEADKMQRSLLKQLVVHGDELPTTAFWHWMRLIEEVGAISHLAEKLANRIRMVLEIK